VEAICNLERLTDNGLDQLSVLDDLIDLFVTGSLALLTSQHHDGGIIALDGP
jgi:hypothetical protein